MTEIGSSTPSQSEVEPAEVKLPKGKQTSLGLYVTVREAYERWQIQPEKVRILGVRTPEEFLFIGHPEMAWNIPLAVQTWDWDSAKGEFPMKLNPNFVELTKNLFTPEDTLLVMCRSGGRSAIAVNKLAAAGFKNVYNITDGFEGDKVTDTERVYFGKKMRNGWKNSAPWVYDVDPEKIILEEAVSK